MIDYKSLNYSGNRAPSWTGRGVARPAFAILLGHREASAGCDAPRCGKPTGRSAAPGRCATIRASCPRNSCETSFARGAASSPPRYSACCSSACRSSHSGTRSATSASGCSSRTTPALQLPADRGRLRDLRVVRRRRQCRARRLRCSRRAVGGFRRAAGAHSRCADSRISLTVPKSRPAFTPLVSPCPPSPLATAFIGNDWRIASCPGKSWCPAHSRWRCAPQFPPTRRATPTSRKSARRSSRSSNRTKQGSRHSSAG